MSLNYDFRYLTGVQGMMVPLIDGYSYDRIDFNFCK